MKKIFFAIVAVAAISFSACNGTAKGGEETDSINADSVVAEAPEANVDAIISSLSTAVADNDAEATQTFLQKAQAYIAKLQEEGKLEEAKVYIAKLQQANVAEGAKDAVVGAANDAANAANDAANAAAQKATDAANNAVESGKKEAGKAIDNAAGAAKSALGI